MGQQSIPVPPRDQLRAIARLQGVEPTDEDLDAVGGFLAVILPALASSRSRAGRATGRAPARAGGRVTLARLAERLRAGDLSPREAVASSLQRIERLEPALNAFVSVRGEEALTEAAALERSSERGPLHGVPVAVKDVIDVAGARTTAASRILADNVAASDATVVARLRRAGAIVVGKLNTHEFAFGATTTSPHFGPARNPWDTDRICGGSSGGSGAAAAAGMVVGTLGTDTAGSIRIPAALCGVTGPAAVDRAGVQPGRCPGVLDVRHGWPDRPNGRGLRAPARGHRRSGPGRPSVRRHGRTGVR